MKSFAFAVTCASLALGLAGTAAAAGRVDVSFAPGDRPYVDAGRTPWDTERTERVLREHLEHWASALPDGQTLALEIRQIDLAGREIPRARNDIRVLDGGADWPRITLHYTLQQGDTVLASGDDTVTDMNYLASHLRNTSTELPYEKRMLDAWFRDHIARVTAAR